MKIGKKSANAVKLISSVIVSPVSHKERPVQKAAPESGVRHVANGKVIHCIQDLSHFFSL